MLTAHAQRNIIRIDIIKKALKKRKCEVNKRYESELIFPSEIQKMLQYCMEDKK